MIDYTDDFTGFTFTPTHNPEPTLNKLNDIFYKGMVDNDITLKAFILYCQQVENMYMNWKNYWIKVLTK